MFQTTLVIKSVMDLCVYSPYSDSWHFILYWSLFVSKYTSQSSLLLQEYFTKYHSKISCHPASLRQVYCISFTSFAKYTLPSESSIHVNTSSANCNCDTFTILFSDIIRALNLIVLMIVG